MVEHEIHYYNKKLKKIHYEKYYVNNSLHREGGPAFIYYDKNGDIILEQYIINGKFHRIDGPAVIRYWKYINCIVKSNEAYYLDGKKYTDPVITDNWIDFCRMQVFI